MSYLTHNLHTNAMWTIKHFPAAMRSLTPSARTKAIEIANQLEQNSRLDMHRIVTISVIEARRWARSERAKRSWNQPLLQTFA